MRHRRLLGLLLLTTLLLTACGGDDDDDADDLAGVEWRLVAVGSDRAPDDLGATITFAAEGVASGNTGCNGFSGQWQVRGSELTISGLVMTAMACEDPVMQWEAAFTRVLGDTRSYIIDGNQLTLRDASDSTLAILER